MCGNAFRGRSLFETDEIVSRTNGKISNGNCINSRTVMAAAISLVFFLVLLLSNKNINKAQTYNRVINNVLIIWYLSPFFFPARFGSFRYMFSFIFLLIYFNFTFFSTIGFAFHHRQKQIYFELQKLFACKLNANACGVNMVNKKPS